MTDTTTTDTTTTTTTADTAKWYDGAEAEIIGHIQTKGWADKPANEAALAATRAHREAEKFVGKPADKLLVMPDVGDSDGWNNLYQKLGRPAEAKDYDFSTVKRGEEALSQADQDFLRDQAFKLNLTKDRATEFAQAFVKRETDNLAASTAETTANLQAAKDKLKANWGANFDANKFIAQQAAAKLGVSPEEINALESVVGYDRVMEMLRNVGSKIGEDKWVANPNPSIPGVMTREQAAAKKEELMTDTAWVKRYNDGGKAEFREMSALVAMIVGDD